METITKDVKGYEGLYTVNNKGEVFSKRSNKYLTLSYFEERNKYYVTLFKDKVSERIFISRLVAHHFVENKDNLYCVRYKDGNAKNNNANNLEYYKRATSKGQAIYQMDKNNDIINKFPSMLKASESTKIAISSIYNASHHKHNRHTAGGYIWVLAEEMED